MIDLFCGAGGLSLGFEQAGFDIALGIDRDGHHVATHERNFPYGRAWCASITDVDGAGIRELLGKGAEIDVVVGGPPCQGFSNMGLRDLKDARNSLIDHYVRLVLELRPKAFVMENVPGMLSGSTRAVLGKVMEITQANRYAITKPVRILDAADFGVPQKRRRLFVIGVREDVCSEIAYPNGKCECQPERPTVWQAISDLPTVEKYDQLFRENQVAYDKQPRTTYARVARGVEEDPSDLSLPRVWDSQVCSGCLRTKHSAKSVRLYEATPPGETVPGHKLPRLDPNGISPTLRAGSDSTHGSYTAPRPIHPKEARCITSREAARLHGFPDWFAFYPLKWHAYRQIGNAVCPPVARAIGAEVARVLGVKRTIREPEPLRLGETFVLPEDRPRTLKRIPQLQQFPPVIAHLFQQAYNKRTKRLRKPTFSFDDVERAIEATGVNLHWVREDNFLPEIARSRRVREMLEPAIAAGFSILPVSVRGAIGKFVPKGTPGTLEDKDTLHIRIGELHDASQLALPRKALRTLHANIDSVFSEPAVVKSLWNTRVAQIALQGVERISNGPKNGSGCCAVTIQLGKKRSIRFAAVSCKSSTLPDRRRIRRAAHAAACDEVAVLVAATTRHIVAMRYVNCREYPREESRAAFELSD